MKYEDMLKRAKSKLPNIISTKERFEVPKVMGHIQGNKTVISNFNQIANALRRDPQHLLKYILKELATPGELKPNGLILGSKVPASRINEKIKKYVDIFVICQECKRPDTVIVKEGPVAYLKCQACGAKHPIKTKI